MDVSSWSDSPKPRPITRTCIEASTRMAITDNGCGFLFVSLYKGFLNGLNAVLFGSFLGITDDQVRVLFLVAFAALIVLLVVGRPLLFASIDPDVAAARGVPTGVLSVVFLLVLALAAAEAAQITGALLVFALLVVPAAAAQ